MSPMLVKAAIAGLAKGVAAIVGITLTAILARVLGADEAGLFFLGLSLLMGLSVVFRLGLDDLVLRAMGAEYLSVACQSKLNTGLIWIVLATVPFSLVTFLFADAISVAVFKKPEFAVVLEYCMLALPATSLFMLLASAFQGVHRVVAVVVFQNLGVSVIFLTLFALLFILSPHSATAETAAAIYFFSAVLVLGFGLWLWFRQPQVQFIFPVIKNSEIWESSSKMWFVNAMSVAAPYGGILIAGAYVQSQELAYLVAAQRTASLIAFVLVVVNTVVAPSYSRLWNEGDLPAIKRLAKSSTRAMLVLALPIVIAMVLFSGVIMRFFGAGFESGAGLLVIIAVGQLINVATGSVSFLLNMTGHERDMRNVTMLSGPVTIVCALWFTAMWGVLGAAYAIALGLTLHNLGALWMEGRQMIQRSHLPVWVLRF
jgi:O-antigen/teichoic acid export membrane protein